MNLNDSYEEMVIIWWLIRTLFVSVSISVLSVACSNDFLPCPLRITVATPEQPRN
jgi:hypothetical protein